jgi:hypothetical protein
MNIWTDRELPELETSDLPGPLLWSFPLVGDGAAPQHKGIAVVT